MICSNAALVAFVGYRDPTWPLTPTMQYTMIRGSSYQIWYIPNLVAIGHFWAICSLVDPSYPLNDLWAHPRTTVQTRVLPTKLDCPSQGCATYGPRAACGPRAILVRAVKPAEENKSGGTRYHLHVSGPISYTQWPCFALKSTPETPFFKNWNVKSHSNVICRRMVLIWYQWKEETQQQPSPEDVFNTENGQEDEG